MRQTIEREEDRFRQTLRTGSAILDTALDKLEPGQALAGDVAFQLHDTYGFPLEVTQEIVAEQGVEVDHAGFDAAMAEQRTRAKDAQRKVGAATRPHRLPGGARGPRPDRLHRPARERDHRNGAGGPGHRGHRRRSPSCSTARPSTPSPAARWATPAPSRPRPAGPRCSTPTTGCPGRTATGPASSRARSPRARRPGPPSTATAATPSAATTPPPTSCTGRCARCSATT